MKKIILIMKWLGLCFRVMQHKLSKWLGCLLLHYTAEGMWHFVHAALLMQLGRDDLYGSELLILLNLYKGSVELFGLLGTIYQCVGRDYIAVGRCQGRVVCNASSCLLCSMWIFLGCCIGNVYSICCVYLTLTLIFYD